ncbi:hypothetical protein [Timonella senegalensis]|uniref:hypothetical protein n=1 Tax=Timonella senegalensis TaxID=1465825 RepID=UPI0028A86F6C|nr:hypothetical protein [Timonella senegalensis]
MKHARQAEDHIDWVHQWQEIEGSTDATEIAGAILAQAHATLALAEQQRIANVIAWTTANGTEPTEETACKIAEALGLGDPA